MLFARGFDDPAVACGSAIVVNGWKADGQNLRVYVGRSSLPWTELGSDVVSTALSRLYCVDGRGIALRRWQCTITRLYA